jgi:hypothetical protein
VVEVGVWVSQKIRAKTSPMAPPNVENGMANLIFASNLYTKHKAYPALHKIMTILHHMLPA